ncbi:uncharacterized protein LOC141632503 [Silene latifolia]|uniref:uncharacterized protein LOC141632503 n=1 Tax=Silene latifolia TaxID=37657 RepID=UPI003D77F25F
MWGKDPTFHNIVQARWSVQLYGYKMFQLVKKLKLLKHPLKELNRTGFANIETTAQVALKHLHSVQMQLQDDPTNVGLQQAVKNADLLYKDRGQALRSFLAQKAKAHWMRDGDDNSHYFHSVIKARRMQNRILGIYDMDGQKHTTSIDIEAAFINYYKHILGTQTKVDKVHIGIVQRGKVLTNEHKMRLIVDVSIIEIKEALLAIVLPDIISENQSAFLKGRDIVDNILICHDLVRLYKRKACSPRCLMKVDLKKAYDSVEWDFIRQMLVALEFPQKMIQWVMECITTPWFTLALNGSTFGYFQGKRGIRQGDPMSPLLFTLSMEYLSRILNFVTSNLEFNYHPMCRALRLTHLCFADDLLMFCRGDRQSICAILRDFATFSKASGLVMNREKSDIYFNGMCNEDRHYVMRVSGFREGNFPFRYLGIPISYKRMAIGDCSRLVERVVMRIRGWGARKLSYAGRLVLVQAVLSQLHSFWARIFLIPVTVMDRIELICRNYLWSGSEEFQKRTLLGLSSLLDLEEALSVKEQLKPAYRNGLGGLMRGDTPSPRVTDWLQGVRVKAWLDVDLPGNGILEWCSSWRYRSLMKKRIVCAAVLALVYQLWRVRNVCRVECYLPSPASVVKTVQQFVQSRAQQCKWTSKYQCMSWTPWM